MSLFAELNLDLRVVLLTTTMSEPDHDDSQLSSDQLDEDFNYEELATPPRRSTRPLLYNTPRHRADRTASLSTVVKHAVVSKSRTPQRCFMTLENAPQSAIDVCHFIPKSTKPKEVGFGLLPIACSLTFRFAAFGTGV